MADHTEVMSDAEVLRLAVPFDPTQAVTICPECGKWRDGTCRCHKRTQVLKLALEMIVADCEAEGRLRADGMSAIPLIKRTAEQALRECA